MKKISKKEILESLLNKLWDNYLSRVAYAKKYVGMVRQHGGRIVNDHIAFRSFNTRTGKQPAGREAFMQWLIPLGYQARANYLFPVKKLSATHFEHEHPDFPKIFVSQLEMAQLSGETADMINNSVKHTPDLLGEPVRELLSKTGRDGHLTESSANDLVEDLYPFFTRPWEPPYKDVVLKVDEESQYAAWVLLHGNAVNHFTAYTSKQNVADWKDIEDTVNALKAAGVPMKDRIEGLAGSKLRQSSTGAVKELCEVRDADGTLTTLEWSYAYYELAERNYIVENGRKKLFNGFLGEQATHLFDMTSTK